MEDIGEEARARTHQRVLELRFPELPVHLALVADAHDPASLRAETQVIERFLVLAVRVSMAFGMPNGEAVRWLTDNGLDTCLSESESQRFATGGRAVQDQLFVESLWAFAWALSLADELDPAQYCGDDLVSLLPDLRVLEGVDAWRARSKPSLRPLEEILGAVDLHYGLTWGLTHARSSGLPQPGEVEGYVHWFRRHALEFVLNDPDIDHASWDDIDLST